MKTLKRQTISPDDIHLWSFCFKDLASDFDALRSLCSRDELERAAHYRWTDDASRFILGRGQLRRLLEAYAGIPAEEVVLSYGPYGKPSLKAMSSLPDIRFNVSHTSEGIVYLFALGHDVGIDIETNPLKSDYFDDCSRIFSDKELAHLQGVRDDKRAEMILTYWIRKEACLKALGVGFSLGPENVDVSTAPEVMITCASAGEQRVQGNILLVEDLHTIGTCSCAIAFEGSVAPKTLRCFVGGGPSLS